LTWGSRVTGQTRTIQNRGAKRVKRRDSNFVAVQVAVRNHDLSVRIVGLLDDDGDGQIEHCRGDMAALTGQNSQLALGAKPRQYRVFDAKLLWIQCRYQWLHRRQAGLCRPPQDGFPQRPFSFRPLLSTLHNKSMQSMKYLLKMRNIGRNSPSQGCKNTDC